jgi:hypothetical protein
MPSKKQRETLRAQGRCINFGSPERPLATKRYCRICQDKRNEQWMQTKHAKYDRVKTWRESNPEKRLTQASRSNAVRSARKRTNGGTVTTKDWAAIKATQGGRCFDCGAEAKLTIGHILPVVRGGSSDPRNIIGQCHPCNRKQGSKIHWLFMTARCVGEAA